MSGFVAPAPQVSKLQQAERGTSEANGGADVKNECPAQRSRMFETCIENYLFQLISGWRWSALFHRIVLGILRGIKTQPENFLGIPADFVGGLRRPR
jgi:hypothetical protein